MVLQVAGIGGSKSWKDGRDRQSIYKRLSERSD